MHLKSLDDVTVALPVLAEITGLSQSAVMAMVRDSDAPKPAKKGAYPLGPMLKWIVQRGAAGASESLSESRRRLADAQRSRVETEVAAMRGELLPFEQVQTDCMAFAAIIAGQLDALPSRVSDQVAAMTDAGLVRAYLTQECRGTRIAASAALARYAEELAEGAATPEKPRRGRPRRIDAALRGDAG